MNRCTHEWREEGRSGCPNILPTKEKNKNEDKKLFSLLRASLSLFYFKITADKFNQKVTQKKSDMGLKSINQCHLKK